jgi:hypothetical protein
MLKFKLVGVIVMIVGSIFLIGAKRGWRWPIDPPEDWSPFYSQSFLKETCGPKAPRIMANVLGIGFILVGLIALIFG